MSEGERPWPFNIDDPVKAVHFHIEPECPYVNIENCLVQERVRQVLASFEIWRHYHPES